MEELRGTMRQVQAKSGYTFIKGWICLPLKGPGVPFPVCSLFIRISRRTANAVAMRLANAKQKLP